MCINHPHTGKLATTKCCCCGQRPGLSLGHTEFFGAGSETGGFAGVKSMEFASIFAKQNEENLTTKPHGLLFG